MLQYPMGMYPNAPFAPGAPCSDSAGYPKPQQAAAPRNHTPVTPLDIPTVKQWLRYCDSHPARSGAVQLSTFCETLESKGFHRIDQLEGVGIDVEKIIRWTDVSPGVALLLFRYAKEDMELIHTGQFNMETPVTSAS
jgi:hypothetical protein